MRARRVGSLGRAGREARELCWRSRTCSIREGEDDLDEDDDVENGDQLLWQKRRLENWMAMAKER